MPNKPLSFPYILYVLSGQVHNISKISKVNRRYISDISVFINEYKKGDLDIKNVQITFLKALSYPSLSLRFVSRISTFRKIATPYKISVLSCSMYKLSPTSRAYRFFCLIFFLTHFCLYLLNMFFPCFF